MPISFNKLLHPSFSIPDWRLWIGPVLFIVGGLIIGWLLEQVIISGIRKIMHRADIHVNGQVAAILRGMVLALFLLGGMYLATYDMPFATEKSMEITRQLLFIIAMIMVIRLSAKMAVALIRLYLTRSSYLQALPNTSIFENILQIIVYLLGALVLLQTLGISVIPLITALGVGGLAISLALQDTLANVFAGINMILARQIKIGDFIKLEGGYEGTIEDIGWRTTVVRQLNNNSVIVPNNKMASSIITNCTLPLPEMSTLVEVAVSYNSDLTKVQQITIDTAKEVLTHTDGAVQDFEPFIRYHTFAESGIHFTVILRVQELVDQYLIKHEFLKRLHERYRQEGIEIPFPQRMLHFNQEMLDKTITKINGSNAQAISGS